VEQEPKQAEKSRDVDRAETPGQQTASSPADQRWIMALQRSAGNRAVASLLTRASLPGAGQPGPRVPTVQRRPDGPDEEPVPKEERVWPVAWPEETEGERNEPCFEPGAMQMLNAGISWAGKGAAGLTARPPDLKAAAAAIRNAAESWGLAEGAEPGQAKLGEARAAIERPLARVSAYALPVETMLTELSKATSDSIAPLREAASAMTEPESADEKPEPCFEADQVALIGRAAMLATEAASELNRRPPDYPKALATLRNAYNIANGIGGRQPGQATLRQATATLGTMLDAVEAYLTPVADVVAEAAEEVRAAADIAKEAGEMAKPGPAAAGGGATPPEVGAS
jgi:hypothetical protein